MLMYSNPFIYTEQVNRQVEIRRTGCRKGTLFILPFSIPSQSDWGCKIRNSNPPSPRKATLPAAQHLLHQRSGEGTAFFFNGFMLTSRNESVYLKCIYICTLLRLRCGSLLAVTMLHPTCLGNKAFLAKIICNSHSLHLYQSGLESLSC